jgi:hypothetical protein
MSEQARQKKSPDDDPDAALDTLRGIIRDFAVFVAGKGAASEADTRVKVIDRILVQVCGWPEGSIKREEHVDSGFIDYSLFVQTRRYLAVEAKKEGIAFTLPTTSAKSLKLSGALLTDKPAAEAIRQVRGYCDDGGIRYAIATNGYAWIVFRAIREDTPWRDGKARIFPSLEYIEAHFTEFWNLLSFNAIQKGSLDEEFGSSLQVSRKLGRVLDRLFKADLPLQRNRLHAQLHPIIQTIFEDIANQDPLEILQSCYVHAGSLRIVARDLNTVITDGIPAFLKNEGAEEIVQTSHDAGKFGTAVSEALTRRTTGQLYLLLGGIGSGKSTFIRRYQRTVGKSVLEGRTLWFHLDFLEAPPGSPSALEPFAWQGMLEQIRTRYLDKNFETRRNIKKAFADKIQVISQTSRAFTKPADNFEKEISPYLERWQADTSDYVPRLLRVIASDRKVGIVIFIDNVDQLSPAYQAEVFVLAERITRMVGTVTVLALREESYYTASLQKTLTAYTSRKFHIASPRFRRMIDARIQFALRVLEKHTGPVDYVLRDGIKIDRAAIADFLKIIESSIFEQNRNIARFIEALCFGNMRLALDMFTMFMTSGATDVDKMLTIYRRSGVYSVAFHEFVKSIMLEDRRYYKDLASPILNLFDCGTDRNASHFTSLRIIRALLQRRGEWNREGQGFVDIAQIISANGDVFDNMEDVLRSLDRMVTKQLVETNTRSTERISGASHVRVTSAGWYYSRFLIKSFAYLDLVLQDTPLNSETVEGNIRSMVEQVDNLSDREDQKLERMAIRFARVREFLDYLQREEETEQETFGLKTRGELWAEPFVPPIRKQIESEIEWIERRVKENRERFSDDVQIALEEREEEDLEVELEGWNEEDLGTEEDETETR